MGQKVARRKEYQDNKELWVKLRGAVHITHPYSCLAMASAVEVFPVPGGP